jgi:hypothetical protein
MAYIWDLEPIPAMFITAQLLTTMLVCGVAEMEVESGETSVLKATPPMFKDSGRLRRVKMVKHLLSLILRMTTFILLRLIPISKIRGRI